MLTCCPFSDCVHGKGQHQLGLGKRSLKESYFPKLASNSGSRHTIACHSATLLYGTRVGLRNYKDISQVHSKPFLIGTLQESNFQPQVNNITLSSPGGKHCKLRVCRFGWELKGTSANADKILHLPSTASSTSELSSKTRLPYACVWLLRWGSCKKYYISHNQKCINLWFMKTICKEDFQTDVTLLNHIWDYLQWLQGLYTIGGFPPYI